MVNRKIGMYSSAINLISVVGFALSMLIGNSFISYFSSMFIAFSFVAMVCAYSFYAKDAGRAAGTLAVAFASMYATIILLVYFTQLTTVRGGNLSKQAISILDFGQFGLFFNYDLLGYALMALSTFFVGLIITVETKMDKWLRLLLLIHGVFFISCLMLPMLGLFTSDMAGVEWIGTAVLEFWCIYFIPISIMSWVHFSKY